MSRLAAQGVSFSRAGSDVHPSTTSTRAAELVEVVGEPEGPSAT